MRTRICAGFVAALLTLGSAGAQSDLTPREKIARILGDAKYQDAMTFLARDHDRIVEETVKLTQIPAPTFKEEAKARAFLEMLTQVGLRDTQRDEAGNVLGVRKGTGNGELLAVAAHLDTVFAESTDVTVKREGSKLRGPGIADDAQGLAAMLALIRAMDAAKIETESDILFIATVGEEALGNLHGMKHVFHHGPYKGRIKTFIALDSVNPREITTRSMPSRRYRVAFSRPGIDSFEAFGSVNPIHAAGRFVVRLAKMKTPDGSGYNVRASGGETGDASSAGVSWLEIDLWSKSVHDLAKIERRIKDIAAAAAKAENGARSIEKGKIAVKIEDIGERPSGATAASAPLVQFAREVLVAHGSKPELTMASGDANVPMSLGIPAITIASGIGGDTHSLDEWIDVRKDRSLRALGIAMTIVLAAAGMRL
jgi:tripeptide aminopeptidase